MSQVETTLFHEGDIESVRRLNRLLIRAVKALGDEGQVDLACRIAAEAWAALRKEHPEEAEKLNGALHYLTHPTPRQPKERYMANAQHLDVRDLPPPRRHALIFDTCGKLPVGNAVILVNDHDPKPLYYQFEAEQPGEFGWEYVESGPKVWRVRITRKKAA
jgi:uncharacterized protein (DUF2249 family)